VAAEGEGIPDARGRRLGGILLGTLLATLVGWSPLGVQPALAAGPLQVKAETTYSVDAADGRVHVAVAYTITNNKPNTPTTIYYYRSLSLGVQAEARNIRASDRSGGLGVSTVRHQYFTEVEVRLRANLYYHRTTTFTVRFDLIGAKPRSATPTRVGRAFVTFSVWAFGDRNQGTVEVRLPAGFTSTVEGDEMASTNGSGGPVLRASPADPESFYSIVTGENRDAFDDERLSLPGGAEIVVLSWPEDDRWAETVSDTLEAGIPELQEMVGLDWPVTHDLSVRERYTPALEGYAGIFFTDDQRIDVSEDLDPITILHEASHAWFNDRLFDARWIYEGLAEEYAWRVQAAVGGQSVAVPDKPDRADKAAVDLGTWAFPEVIRDDTNAAEVYGYEASFWLVHLVVDGAGEDRMRDAFASAEANLTAYPGEGLPEKVAAQDDWRRFLDLTQPLDEPDAAPVIAAVEEYVVGGQGAAQLDARLAARDAYRDLLEAGDGWLPPWYVREPMGAWQFDAATSRMAAATAVLALRDQAAAAAAGAGLTLDDDALEAAYEGAKDGFDEASTIANEQLEAVGAISQAAAAVGETPDLVAEIGLMGEPRPPAQYEAARAAFEAGDTHGAMTLAATATALVGGAPARGQERLVMGAIVGVALLAFVVFLIVLRRRRSRHAIGVEPGSAGLLALDARLAPGAAGAAEPVGASGTLGADPDRPPTPPGEAAPDSEGGPVGS
jgi:hypothetical protein